MASASRTSASPSTRKALLLLAIATMANAQQLVPKGCYTSVTPLTNAGTATYQSSGACAKTCAGQAVFALSQGNTCYCGSELPAASSKTSLSACNIPCDGYNKEPCGGANAYTVWLTGIDSNPPVYDGDSTGGGTASGTMTGSPGSTSTARHSVFTSVEKGTTVYVTHSGVPSSTPGSSSGSGGGSGVAGIAAGVVVGVGAAIAIVAGVFFYLRHRRKEAAEEEYKRTQVSDFMRGGDKPPTSAYSQTSDSRLDPESGARRNSEGSIADAGDYSRRILRVANPDNS